MGLCLLFFFFLRVIYQFIYFIVGPCWLSVLVICLFLAVLGLCCCLGFALVAESKVLIAVASLVSAPGLQGAGSVVVVCRLSCSEACELFLDQGSNLCLWHWQADSLPLSHRGSPGYLPVLNIAVWTCQSQTLNLSFPP